MAQNRIPRGEHGLIVVKKQPNGVWLARVQLRDISTAGSDRSASPTAPRALQSGRCSVASANAPTPRSPASPPETAFETLARAWLQHRRDHGKVRTNGALAPQTLATYNNEIEQVVIPAIGDVQVREATVPFLDRLFADVEHGRRHGRYAARPGGRSTRQLRVVMAGMLGLAVAPLRPARQPRPRRVEDLA